MKKQILTGLGVLLLGSTVAFAAPQSVRSNFNDSPAYQTQPQQQQRQWNQRGDQRQQTQRVNNQYTRNSRRAQQQHHKVSRAKHRKNRDRSYNWRG